MSSDIHRGSTAAPSAPLILMVLCTPPTQKPDTLFISAPQKSFALMTLENPLPSKHRLFDSFADFF